MKLLTIALTCVILSGCIEAEVTGGASVDIPPLPCIDGWQFNHLGEPLVNMETGAQLMCGWRLNEE